MKRILLLDCILNMWTLSCGLVAIIILNVLSNNVDVNNKIVKSYETNSSDGKLIIVCNEKDTACKRDNISLEAIYEIHHLIDDDQNGNVDQSESDEFMRDELQYTEGFERLSIFHGNDKLISVSDLWRAWRKSQVFNWTVDEVTEWLVKHVELAQYVPTFKAANIDGTMLPSIAILNNNFTRNVLGIKNAIHRQKISVKAMDLVLFGPPKEKPNHVKDVVLLLSLLIALAGCWFAYSQHKSSKVQMKKVMEEMDNLQKAEESLQELQNKLEKAEEKQKSAYEEKETLEMRYQDEIDLAKREAEKLRKEREEGKQEENISVALAEKELEQVRAALKRAEKELAKKQIVPQELQDWLQLTYETEQSYFNIKKHEAERQLEVARDECRKIQKKRGAFLGPLRMAPSNSIDQFDHKIEKARFSLDEVRKCLTEKSQRWHHIEKLCGFPIANNPGREALLQALYIESGGTNSNFMSSSAFGSLNIDEAELDEDPQFAMFYSMSNGYSRPSMYSGYNMQLRQRPKTLVGSNSSLARSMLTGSTNSLPRSIHPASKVNCDNPISPLSDSTSSGSDQERPLFSLDETSEESPSVCENNKPSENGNTELSQLMTDVVVPPGVSPLSNGSQITVRERAKTHDQSYRDSTGNASLPSNHKLESRESCPALMPKSQSDLNLKSKYMMTSISLEEGKKIESIRKDNSKKRNQFLKIFKKSKKS